jgi:tetratricopeptide (TPR) repeat protein
MKVLSITLLLTAALFSIQCATAQDSLSARDATEIRHKGENLIKDDLKGLINAISSTSFESQETADNIHNSYSEGRNQIFRDSLVRVEPDVDPTNVTSSQSGDEQLDRYLKDIDLLYNKTDSSTIQFSNIRCSDVKKKDNIYIKVYFNSVFSGKSSVKDQHYTITNRLAEIWAQKEKGQWRLFIVRLAFFNPADTAGDIANNVPLKFETNPFLNLGTKATAQDSAAAIQKQMTFEEEEQQKYVVQLAAKDQQDETEYKRLLLLGDDARKQQDYPNALKYFKQAHDMRPTSVEVNIRVKKTNEEMTEFAFQTEKLFQQFMEKADLLARNRQYKEAIDNYQEARKQKPAAAASIDSAVRILTAKFSVLSDLQEKYNAGFVKEALKECKDAIKKDPSNSDLYLMQGRCYEKLTDESKSTANALASYSRAIELDPYNLAAIRYRAEIYVRGGDYFKALSDFKLYLTVDKTNMEMYERKSEMHILLKLNTEAVRDLDEALAIDAKAAHIYLTKGLLLYNQGDIKQAADNFTTCLRIDSANALAWFSRGRCEILLNKIPEAATDFAAARDKGLDTTDRRTIADYAEKFYGRSSSSFTAGRTDSAIVYVDYAISIEPSSALDRFSRGEYYYSQHKYNEAILSYDKAIAFNGSYMEAWYRRGLARYNIGDYKEAITNFQAALKLDPANVLAQKGEGDADLALKDYVAAAAAHENALRLAANARPPVSPNTLAEICNSLCRSYFEAGDLEKAVNNGKNAIRYNRNLAEAYFNRGNAYARQGSLSDAIEDLTKAVAMEDAHAQWHYVLGRTYLEKKDYANAQIQFAACARLDKEGGFPDAVYRQGYCNYEAQNYTAALPLYSRALALQLDTAVKAFDIEIGVIYLNTGKFDSASLFFRKVYVKDSTNGYASYGIASALALEGKADESMAWFEKSFQTKNPSYSEIKRDKLLADMRNNKKFKDLLKKYF